MGVQVPLPAPSIMRFHYKPTEDKEAILIERFGLLKTSEVYNRKVDAVDEFGNNYELKSCSKKTEVSTARDFNIRHVHRWRQLNFIVGFWNNETSEFEDIYLLLPKHMNQWLDDMETEFSHIDRILDDMIWKSIPFDEYDWSRVEKLLKRAKTKNDPRIKTNYIISNGIKINSKEDLQRIMQSDIME